MLRFMNDAAVRTAWACARPRRSSIPQAPSSAPPTSSPSPRTLPASGCCICAAAPGTGREIVPRAWVDYARSPTIHTAGGLLRGSLVDESGQSEISSTASGFDGQRILCDPARDLIIVRLGRTPVGEVDYVWERVFALAELF